MSVTASDFSLAVSSLPEVTEGVIRHNRPDYGKFGDAIRRYDNLYESVEKKQQFRLRKKGLRIWDDVVSERFPNDSDKPVTVKIRKGFDAASINAREVAKQYDVNIALHTDHCPKDKLDGFVLPLLAESEKAVARGEDPIFNSHMWDGSAIDLDENLKIAAELLERTNKAKIVLEVEIGAVGGEEDGVEGAIDDSLYTTVDDAVKTVEALGLGEKGRYIAALTFGNVHGVYKPGNVHLRPELLKQIQDEIAAKYGKEKPFSLVFHGGSGSTAQEIADAVSYGVIKMNIDTDTQYAFTRPVAGHMFTNYDGVLKVDGEVGNKKAYDPRVWGAKAEEGMAARVVEACQQLGSAGTSLNK